jgi:Tol biopolymer transport system component
VAAVAVAVLLIVPATAGATLTFVRGPLKPIVWAAQDDGSHAHQVAPGTTPRLSPDGQHVVYSPVKGGRFGSELVVSSVDGSAPPHRLLGNWREPFVFAWSPDSTTIAVLRGPEFGARELVLIDVACETGEVLCLRVGQHVVAKGYFNGVSFAPDRSQLVYARSGSEEFPPRSDVFRVDVSGGKPTRLTSDHRSVDPLWGPNGQIVFAMLLAGKQRRFGPKNELFLMNPSGREVRRLTHTEVDPLLQGLFPTQWSADGGRLLAEFEGQDTSYAVAVNPKSGAQHPVGKIVAQGERGLVGTALSADCKLVLGYTGGAEPGPGHDVVAVPYGGGRQQVLAKNAFEPDWSR